MDYVAKPQKRGAEQPLHAAANEGPQTFIIIEGARIRISHANLLRCFERIVAGDKVEIARYGTKRAWYGKPIRWDLTDLTLERAEELLQILIKERDERDNLREQSNPSGGQ